MRRPDRAARAGIAVALCVAIPAFPWLIDATLRASRSALGRDQGIFQYIAWAASRGEKLYRDVRDVNGPLVAMIHLALQKLGGEDEHRFRSLDLFLTSGTFAFVGACLPSLAKRDVAPVERAAWSFAAVVVLLAQYLAYGFWDTAQRESFFDWFLAVATGALLVAQARSEADRRALGWLGLAGACSVAPVFGKPTYALFTVAHVVTVAIDRGAPRRLRRLAAFAGGAAAATFGAFAFLASYGDVSEYLRISLSDVPAMYRFIWPRTPAAIMTMPGYGTTCAVAVAATIAGSVLVAIGRIPRRALALATVPVLGVVSVLVQAKGFPYHFHPITFGIGLSGVALVLIATEQAPRWAAFALAALLALRAAATARDAGIVARREHDSAYVRVDYFPQALARTAAHLRATTRVDDRVQTYAMDPYVLFLARRMSATPYIYAYDLDADAALHGSFDEGGPHPSPEEAARIQAIRDAHESDLRARLEHAPPAAFVFIDRSPLMSSTDAFADFESHCPTIVTFVLENYVEAANFEGMRVWSRSDLR